MIRRLAISNYKSIESATLDCRRVNVFIGEPNSGKSNLLEALALFSPGTFEHSQEILRSDHTSSLFFDNEVERLLAVDADEVLHLDLKFYLQSGTFDGLLQVLPHTNTQVQISSELRPFRWPNLVQSPIRYYRFSRVNRPSRVEYGSLGAPFGNNLVSVLQTNKAFRESVSALFRSKRFRLEILPQTQEMRMSKEVNEVLYSYRPEAISETLRRIVFYKAVLETNQNAILVLDEPEANTFPFYTKYLAEQIALDETNQFFLSTHNPYVLTSIIEKTPEDALAVHVTRMRDFRTEFQKLDSDALARVLDLGMSAFFNLDRFFPDHAPLP